MTILIPPGVDLIKWPRQDFPTEEAVAEEMSVYATEAYYAGPDSRLRRFVYRKDGFVALTGSGTMLTKPIIFDGRVLTVNSRCGDGGSVKVEVCDVDGKPLPGFSVASCRALVKDSIDGNVEWTAKQNLADLAGNPVRLRFHLTNADVFTFQFRP